MKALINTIMKIKDFFISTIDFLTDQIEEIWTSIMGLTADQIAVISLAVTLLLFALGKHSENKIKIYETRKEEYRKLIEFFKQIFASKDRSSEEIVKDEELKKQMLDMGSSLAIFGSKKLYKTYCFYRWIALDENVKNSRWYSDDMMIYSFGEMYQIMRKEVGLNRDFIPVDVPDLLSFCITDFTKPQFKKRFYKYHFNKYALKSAIFWGKVEDFIPLVWIQNYIAKPFFFSLFCVIRFPVKLLIVTPIKQIKKHTNKK
ncbi:MAG: hypothetical protein UEP78_08315 [Negativibacillus sp.]|nr:hypothetical protein [Negativibacillus sp.]